MLTSRDDDVVLNIVMVLDGNSVHFFSPLLSSVSPIVLTVIDELPSTSASDDAADFPCFLQLGVKRKRNRDFVFRCVGSICSVFFFRVLCFVRQPKFRRSVNK